jgi:hypothetical protein
MIGNTPRRRERLSEFALNGFQVINLQLSNYHASKRKKKRVLYYRHGRARQIRSIASASHPSSQMNPLPRPTNSTPGRKRRPRSLLVPRTSIAQAAPSRAFTGSTQLGGQVLFGDLFDEFRLEALAEDRDLGDGDLVEPRLDERPDGGEEVGGLESSSSSVSSLSRALIRIETHVDDVELAHDLGVCQRASHQSTAHSPSPIRPPKTHSCSVR